MRRFIVLFFSFLSLSVNAQNLETLWLGKLAVGAQTIELRFHIKQLENDTKSVSIDVPIQKAIGINASKVVMKADSISIEFGLLKADYKGKFINKDSINGNWNQSRMDFPLSFKKVSAFEDKKVNRPQTPKPPYSYLSEDIVYTGKHTALTYGATLTYPSKEGKYPLLILITGSGQQDRDETIFDHKPFAVLADYLTRNGMAVMRVDDRGKGKSTGQFAESTSYDFSEDVEEHIAYAKTLAFIDQNKIGLLGHSEGGMIAPMVAARNKDVSFIILMAGPGIDIVHGMELQNKYVLKASGISDEAIYAYLPLYVKVMQLVSKLNDKEEAISKVNDMVNKWYQVTDKKIVQSTTGIKDSTEINKYVSTVVGQLSSKWWKYFANFDPAVYLSKVYCPVLAINGEKDIQIAADENLNGIEKALIKAKNKRYTVKKMDGLNHLFQKCNACSVTEYGEIENTIDPVVLSTILQWLQAVQVL